MSNWGVMQRPNPLVSSGGSGTSTDITTPSAWGEMMILPVDCSAVTVSHGAVSSPAALEIGIGSAGNEIAPLAPFFTCGLKNMSKHTIPINLPAGTRVCARAAMGNGWHYMNIVYHPAGPYQPTGLSNWVRYGGNEDWSDSAGNSSLTIDPGATANTYGAWTEIVAAVPFDVRFVMIGTKAAINGDSIGRGAFNLGVGSAGNEIPLVSDFNFYTSYGSADGPYTGTTQFEEYLSIPAGSRLSIQMKTSTGTSPARLKNVYVALGG